MRKKLIRWPYGQYRHRSIERVYLLRCSFFNNLKVTLFGYDTQNRLLFWIGVVVLTKVLINDININMLLILIRKNY